MPLRALQYRPNTFDKFVVHRDIALNLQKLVRPQNTHSAQLGKEHKPRG